MSFQRSAPPTMFDVLFLDIETVCQSEHLPQTLLGGLFGKRFRYAFDKAQKMFPEGTAYDELWNFVYKENAPLNAEFGKIFNISIGVLQKTETKGIKFYVRSMCSRDEKTILQAFFDALTAVEPKALCAHNGQEFDFPWLDRRGKILGLNVPGILDPFWKKPWELTDVLLDTRKIFGGTQYNHHCSLDLLANIFGIPSPKADMDGSMVSDLYWSAGDGLPFDDLECQREVEIIQRVGQYGGGDVVTLAKIYCHLTGCEKLTDDQIEFIQWPPAKA